VTSRHAPTFRRKEQRRGSVFGVSRRRCFAIWPGRHGVGGGTRTLAPKPSHGGVAMECAMASIRKEISIDAPAEEVWSAFRDIGAVHTRLAPGFVTDCRMDGKDRIVTFVNGFVVREVIVDIDDEGRRFVYSARSENLAHHNASFHVMAKGEGGCRVVWVADLLPDDMAARIEGMMDQGSVAMKKALERQRR
jgi:carbon monoxide dehydrogenase subunit G